MSLPPINESHFLAFLDCKEMGEWIAPGLGRFVSNAKVKAVSGALMIDRRKLKEIARKHSGHSDRDVMWTILWWGGMKIANARKLAGFETEAAKIVGKLRHGEVRRAQAYQAFLDFRVDRPACGLGPAFFTKLIFFARPDPDGYIMDQHVARSINLLFEGAKNKIVKLDSEYVSRQNGAADYEQFCRAVEIVRDRLNAVPDSRQTYSGEDVEKLLFSPSPHKQESRWRDYLAAQCG